MFLDDIALVEEQIQKYGFKYPLGDLGGQAMPVLADYSRLPDSPFIRLESGRPFDHIDPNYEIVNPELGDAPIESMPQRDYYGTVICLSTLEHVENPFEVMAGLYRVLKPDGLLILSTVFSFRYHPAPRDLWRFSPDCLDMLAAGAGFKVLESGWRLSVDLYQGDELNSIRSVYVIAKKEGKENVNA